MFYKAVEAAYLAGKVRVGFPALGQGDRITIEARGFVGVKAAFLNRSERQMLADLSKANAMAVKTVESK